MSQTFTLTADELASIVIKAVEHFTENRSIMLDADDVGDLIAVMFDEPDDSELCPMIVDYFEDQEDEFALPCVLGEALDLVLDARCDA